MIMFSVGDSSSEQNDEGSALDESDPMKYCSHIQGRIKQTQQRVAKQKIEATMTTEECMKEREIQRHQLQEIFQVMEGQKDMFGVKDVSDIQEQLKMYVQ